MGLKYCGRCNKRLGQATYISARMLLHDLIILTVIGLACGAGKAHICAGNGAACCPDGSAADHAGGPVFLCRK